MENTVAGGPMATDCGVIEVHLRELTQLFESLDPSPFHEKDLDHNAEAYIVDSLKEQPTRAACALVLHLDKPPDSPEEAQVVGEAVRVHFARRAGVRQRQLRQLLRRGLISLIIGLVFLAAVFVIAQFIMGMLGDRPMVMLFREGLMIIGWVAMWRPLEIFLYDWWPIVGERRIHERLSRVQVRITYGEPRT